MNTEVIHKQTGQVGEYVRHKECDGVECVEVLFNYADHWWEVQSWRAQDCSFSRSGDE
jgi:hypothetical protein